MSCLENKHKNHEYFIPGVFVLFSETEQKQVGNKSSNNYQ